MLVRFSTGVFAIILACHAAGGDEIRFNRDIRPILSENCFHCHGPDENARQAELRLDTREGVLGNRDAPGVVSPGNAETSELIRRIVAADPADRMPPREANRSLTAAQVGLIRDWVESGAPWEQHWAFLPLRRPPTPIGDVTASRTTIDVFVDRQLRQVGLNMNRPATREKLIRRVTLDLTGLPPTPAEVDAFLEDDSADSYERVVDRLLASPRYGERMVWDWLEAARYADTNGFQGDPLRTMWPWRDWVIRAFNDNMPYDQFTVEQLAGDLLPNATRRQRIATGFNRNHMHNGEGGRIAEETRVENVLDRVETTGTVWLGLTLTCCRCHDHKFDPLRQREYYQLYAYFNNTSEDGRTTYKHGVSPTLDVPTLDEQRRLDELADQIARLAGQVAGVERGRGDGGDALPEEIRRLASRQPIERSPAELQQLIDHFRDSESEYASLLTDLKSRVEARNQIEAATTAVMVMDALETPRPAFVLDRGLYNKPLSAVTPGVPEVLPPLPADAPPNRLAFARWLVSDDHPLTARVTVNRIWQSLFGTGLVGTPGDFGVQGERPSHPDLLDWLAVEFVESGWDIKALQKQIVMTATYRQSARVAPAAARIDPGNRFLSHAPRHRLPAWMIRDAALAASGLLVERVGGPPVKPYQPPGIWQDASFGKIRYEQDQGENLYRRSVYTFWRRIVGPTMFFDSARRQTCEVKPAATNSPLHALTTLNDTTYVEAARVMAGHIIRQRDTPQQRITLAFRRVTSRAPRDREIELLVKRLETLQRQYAEAPEDARRLVAVGAATRDGHLDPVDHAAYSGVCLLLFNLDEALTK